MTKGGIAWQTVPPQGYGGIQWVNANLIDGLLELGHEITLLGAPGSVSNSRSLIVVDAATPGQIEEWLTTHQIDIIHDSSNGVVNLDELRAHAPCISTHHLTGGPRYPLNCVYISHAQRHAAGGQGAPVVRLPVNPARYKFKRIKGDFLLFLGRVAPWKGTMQAAAFAKAAGMKLVVAGPNWEEEYFDELMNSYADNIHYLGEVDGEERLNLLADSRAVLVMSQPVEGPWGGIWSEPGATVVSEASVSGTPVISTDNGCLREITPFVGHLLRPDDDLSPEQSRQILDDLSQGDELRRVALHEWGHIKVATQYEALYREIVKGYQWQ